MTETLTVARSYLNHCHDDRADHIALNYEDRFMRRKVLTTYTGLSVLVDLPQTTSLDHDGALVLENGHEVRIVAAAEELFEVTGDCLSRIAWHIGNRHTPCQIENTRLLIQRDHVMRDMLGKIGAHVREVVEPFTPEGGAYGHGRTHGHAH
ncbi:urease accessory protein UreE [uncultured Shimia sp.]|uniref:urease accessory protein UreE n=1 Tax=uncultured Shimia sp. TaxID=573152 RepID=UPI00261915B8|nr:urease accessory protein UreE [uncultured Shimia sp.]